ncbi:nitroreductase family deazaflavin-dependent oxidoreductase [Actinoplanes sp. NPDC051513]|uniref:nitroreductase family deazaflavin-dependent oxidoreductase n=1 Tax=Actinoplanes sp. NPDC051513 TaxID=3363908 RepID=UPI0037A9BED7
MPDKRPPRVPARWIVRTAWVVHRGLYRVTAGRVGLWRPKGTRWGALRLTTVGRRSGKRRSVILAYFEDGPNLVLLSMNGWGEGEPAWSRNLRAAPEATAEVAGRPHQVRARLAEGDEHSRLWDRWRHFDKELDGYAGLRTTPTTVFVLEPR